MAQGASYDPLPQDDEDKLDLNNTSNTPVRGEGRFSNLSRQAIRASLIILGICAIVDACLAGYGAWLYLRNLPRSFADTSSSSSSIPLRSTYIGFDRLYSSKQSPVVRPVGGDPIINLPRASLQISAKEKTKVFPQWTDSIVDDNGIVPVLVQRLYVAPQISTIVQFRAIDYGMEDCALVLTVPSAQTNNSGFVVSDFEEDRVSKVDVWALSTDSKLDPRTLSWNTRPERSSRVGKLDTSLGPGLTYEIYRFSCSWGSYYTFELACATSDCGVDATSMNKTATGLYLLQHPTL